MANESVYIGFLGPITFQSSAAGIVFNTPVLVPNGTAAAPSISFSAHPDTGLFYTTNGLPGSVNALGIAAAGLAAAYFAIDDQNHSFIAGIHHGVFTNLSTSGIMYLGNGTTLAPALTFESDPQHGWYRSNAGDAWSLTYSNTQMYRLGTTSFGIVGTRNFIWDTDGGGNIGASGATRPDKVFWKTAALANDGTFAVPSYSFAGDPDSGMYSVGANALGFVTGGSPRASLTNAAWKLPSNFTVSWTNTADDATATIDTSLARLSAGVVDNNTATGGFALRGALAIASTAPTAAGTGMSFSVATGATSFAWSITISTANAQSAFTVTLPTAANGWYCTAESLTNPGSMKIAVSSRSTTTVVLTQYSQTTGLAAAFADGNVITGSCVAY